jgi:hypothetical protein
MQGTMKEQKKNNVPFLSHIVFLLPGNLFLCQKWERERALGLCVMHTKTQPNLQCCTFGLNRNCILLYALSTIRVFHDGKEMCTTKLLSPWNTLIYHCSSFPRKRFALLFGANGKQEEKKLEFIANWVFFSQFVRA